MTLGSPGSADQHTATQRARTALAGLMSSVGSLGLAAAATAPALLAAIDQHAAAVRDSLQADLRPLSAIALAGYVEGIRDAAREHGWRMPEGHIDFAAGDWVLTRLLAVCSLAQGLPTRA
ncbi:DUF6401 family natural product biosynthesis protein [Catenuloplanes atrovinosus]|uniref:Uncharacterized protein n=1 Tax=Catenuloplanes atrovinosus TaxID=137266 RepID=A0AAE3YJH3_9ACTN|nr:DUF6401 family natural product biosynthesis protein [Catenuloplanes atrovinosus]MDR7274027.1 hypothetical protein [Catenuloplanes atrovinosus]